MLQTVGLRFRKIDVIYFIIGMVLPTMMLFLVYLLVKPSMNLPDGNFLTLILMGQRKTVHYLVVAVLEEVIFRGILFGVLLKTIKNKKVACFLAALIFALPHMVNTDEIPLMVMFLFPLLYGILANEMFYVTESIWMPIGLHWMWNYTIVSVFLATGTQNLTYIWVIMEMLVMIPALYFVFRKP